MLNKKTEDFASPSTTNAMVEKTPQTFAGHAKVDHVYSKFNNTTGVAILYIYL